MREVIATGNVLIAKAAIDCGCKFFWRLSYYS